VDREALKASNEKIADALKTYNKAIDKAQKADATAKRAKSEANQAREAYLVALDEAKKVVA
jgi:hypothetical protein